MGRKVHLISLADKKGFTLLELIIVIVIIGILATLGFNQYSLVVEKGRTAEAMANISIMRKLAHDYYLKNGSLDNITNSDVGVDDTCASGRYYSYRVGTADVTSERRRLVADRCTSGGKNPDTSRRYYFYLLYYPGTGTANWHCYYTDDASSCFGLPGNVAP